jgi:hypothetical protein
VVTPDEAIDAGRRIAGLIGHSPGPGIYSRMQRAVEAMPEMVRAEEIPGLIRRHKEGVPGWELKAADIQGLVGEASVIPRQDLLDRVRERSPVYTHKEVVLGGRPALGGLLSGRWAYRPFARARHHDVPEYQGAPSQLGQGVSHGPSRYSDYGHGGDDYSELLLLQPNAQGEQFGSHWLGSNASGARDAVAHARYDTHGDALRINELQSDLGIHNRKIRESKRSGDGWEDAFVSNHALPFPLEDAWSDLLIKRLALEAARGGHRAIEVASPRQIADKVGGNIDNYEHFYGKVVPGAIERLGGKMGGLKRESAERLALPADPSEAVEAAIEAAVKDLPNAEMPDWAYQAARGRIRNAFNELAQEYASNTWRKSADIEGAAGFLHSRLRDAARQYGMPREAMDARMPQLMRAAEIAGAEIYARPRPPPEPDDAIRYLMSDEMRRNILRNGIPASVLGAAALSNERQP